MDSNQQKKNINKFELKIEEIRQRAPSRHTMRTLMKGLEYLAGFLRRKQHFDEFSEVALNWMDLIEKTKERINPEIFSKFIGAISIYFIKFLEIRHADRNFLNLTLRIWSKLLTDVQKERLKKTFQNTLNEFKRFGQVMFALGDYHCQTLAVDVLCRYTTVFGRVGAQPIIQQILPGADFEKARAALETMNFSHFDLGCRVFLNLFNQSFSELSVFSVKFKLGFLFVDHREPFKIINPVDWDGSTDLWIDFNFREFTLSFFVDIRTFAQHLTGSEWVFIEIELKNVVKFQLERISGRKYELLVCLKQKITVPNGEEKYIFNQIVMRGRLRSSQVRFIMEQVVPVYRTNED